MTAEQMDHHVWHGLIDAGAKWPQDALDSAEEHGDFYMVATMASAIAKKTGDIPKLREILTSMDVELDPLPPKDDRPAGLSELAGLRASLCLY